MSSRSLNKVTLIGNLTRDPELRYTPQGTAVCTIGLATNRSWTTDAGEKREETEFHRLVAWNKLAELCAQLLVKGRKVYVEGRLQTRSWTAQDGTQRTVTEIVIDDMILLDSKRPIAPVTGVTTEENKPIVSTPVAKPAPIREKIKEEKKTEEVVETPAEATKASSDQPKEDINADDIPF